MFRLICTCLTAGLWTGWAQVPQQVTLDQAVNEALAKNPDLGAERLGIPVAEARGITAALRPNPVLTVSGSTLELLWTRFTPTNPAGPNQPHARWHSLCSHA